MKILLVTRGTQGDIYPYIRLAAELKKRGHQITLSLPRLFEKEARDSGVSFVLQASDDIAGMMADTPDTKNLLEWTKRVIDSQFREIIPMLEEHDILIASNTEFAAPSVAEYCGKPYIRTAYGPFIPGKKIPPPVFPWAKPHPVFTPAFLWKLLNTGLNLMVKKTLNKNREALGMPPIADQAEHAPANADNFMLYSRYLGTYDTAWKYRWEIGGYCFNDTFSYDTGELERLQAFIKKDSRPVIFFTLGSCNVNQRDRFAGLLFDICVAHNYKLAVSCGWWKVGARLDNRDNLFRLESPIPHWFIFPRCDAIIHHGGVGTTHSAARSGKPQMIVPLLLDQFYWANRIEELGIGPGGVKLKGISRKHLEEKVVDLAENPSYREKADSLGILVRSEEGLENACRYIETYRDQAEPEKEWA
jgi:UDP:flavonoid glycosyltransferase YjiC (YdhE family)